MGCPGRGAVEEDVLREFQTAGRGRFQGRVKVNSRNCKRVLSKLYTWEFLRDGKSKKGIRLDWSTTKCSSQPTRCFKIRKRVFESKGIRIFIVPRSILVALATHDTSRVKQAILTRVNRYSHQLASNRFILAPKKQSEKGFNPAKNAYRSRHIKTYREDNAYRNNCAVVICEEKEMCWL